MMKENISFHYGYFLLPVTIRFSLRSNTLAVYGAVIQWWFTEQ
ncbi:hypothetical protein [Veillonella magna]|nr:hypothetical protein [Veillonella magna]